MKTKSLHFFLIFILIVKFILATLVPVFGDEAYYYVWSLHPQLSYFDHPAMVSWIIYLNHLILPAGNSFGLRFLFVVLSYLTSLIWFKILKDRGLSSQSLFVFFLFLFLNPLLGLGSILATPDVLLVFFWSLAYLFFERLFKSDSLLNYIALGISLGLGFCSKYHIVLFVFAGFVYILISKQLKKLKFLGVILTIIFGALFCSPVLIWNAQNEWQSFVFQINHGFGEADFSWNWPIGYLIAQTLIINPFILISLFKKSENSTDKVFSLSQLGFFFTSAFKSVVEGNWPLTSHPHSIAQFLKVNPTPQLKKVIGYWLCFYLLLGGFFISAASKKVRKNLVNSSQLEEIYDLTAQFQPLYGASYQVASLLSWKTQKNIPKLALLSRHDFYDSLAESKPTAKTFYVLKYDYSDWPSQYAAYKKIKIQGFDNSGLELYQFNYE